MTLPLLSKSHPDILTAQRRTAETVNDILTFKHDDSRTQTPSESTPPLNAAYAPGNVKRYGASSANTLAQNKAALQKAISAASVYDPVVTVPSDISYGYKITDKTTWPDFSASTVPIIVQDFGPGNSYAGFPTAYDGAQARYFSFTPQTTVAGEHDGNNFIWRAAWAPNIIISNDADLSGPRTADDNRRARFLIENEGNGTWGIGQAANGSATATSEQLSDFFIQKFAAPGDTLSSINCLRIERMTGNWLFNAGANLPLASYHFVSTVAGFVQGLFETNFSTTCLLGLRNSNGSGDDVYIKNEAGALALNISGQGDALTFDKANRRATPGASVQTLATVITYAANMTPDATLGNVFKITATNGTAFSIGSPSGTPSQAMRISIILKNTSGGALGAITWSTASGGYKMDPAWTKPANGFKVITDFLYDVADNVWNQVGTAVAVPN